MTLFLSHEQFEQLVLEALAMLPPFIQEQISNVEVLVETWPSVTTLREMGMPPGGLLLGLYHGIPLTERTSAYQLVTPDTITLYQGPIEQVAGRDANKIRDQVRHTVIHEFAHHFGISDDRLRELGAY
jgi:predicted Zn-dependent protease with MMP-like domain